MRIYFGAKMLAMMVLTSFSNAQTVWAGDQPAKEVNAEKKSDPEHWRTPSEASITDRTSMREWYRLNELCRGSSDAATVDAMCPKRDRANAALEQRGWCWPYDDDTVSPTDYRWHRCSQKALLSSHRTTQPDTTLPIEQTNSAFIRSATKARDIGGFALGMSVTDAARLAPLQKISDNDYRTTKNGVEYDFGVTPLGHIFRVDSSQGLGKFTLDDVFRQSLLAKLSAKYGPPKTASVDTFQWSLIELVKGTGERALPFETNWATAYLDDGGDRVTLHVKLLDFRIEWWDEAQLNRFPREKAVGEVEL